MLYGLKLAFSIGLAYKKTMQKDTRKNNDFTDIQNQTWISRLPKAIQPYGYIARFDRPIGIWLLLFPCLFGYSHALFSYRTGALQTQDLLPFLYFTIGAIVMRAAGCVINDIWDRQIDAKVTRTKTRPLANGDMSLGQAIFFLCVLSLTGLVILAQFPRWSIQLGCASILLVILYPLAKRFTHWPQLILGLTFNWGALLGMSLFYWPLPASIFYIYGACVFWTLGYDTIYAYQDIKDDKKIGVKSTAILFGKNGKIALGIFYGISAVLLAIGLNHAVGLLPLFHFAYQIMQWDMNDRQSCLDVFKSNRLAGWLILFTILLYHYFF